MSTLATTRCYISLNRLAQLTGHSRVTLLLRLKDGKLQADATMDIGGGKLLPLFFADKAALPQAAKSSARQHPLL
jgi:hypothetical protein